MRLFIILSAVLGLCILVANRNLAMFSDATNYSLYFNKVIIGDEINAEKSFVYISRVMQFLGIGLSGVFFVYAFIGIFLKVSFYLVKLPKYFYLVFLYLTSYFVVHDLVQIRVGAALGLSLWAIYFFGENKPWRSVVLFCMAIALHIGVLPLFIFSIALFAIDRAKVDQQNICYLLAFAVLFLGLFLFVLGFLGVFSPNLFIGELMQSISALPTRYKENYLTSDLKIGYGKIVYSFFLSLVAFFYLRNAKAQNFLSRHGALAVILAFFILITMRDYSVISSRLADTFLFFSPWLVYGVCINSKFIGNSLFAMMLVIQLINVFFYSTVIMI
jgi:hypothetical protein